MYSKCTSTISDFAELLCSVCVEGVCVTIQSLLRLAYKVSALCGKVGGHVGVPQSGLTVWESW